LQFDIDQANEFILCFCSEKLNRYIMDQETHTTFPILDTDLLRTFVAIAETGSFRAAAKRVYRTPSAVSMQIKKLEDTLGRPLFLRDGRQVTMTADGETLLGYGRRMLKLNDEAVARFVVPAVEGCVRLGAPDDFGTRFLPNILARFAAVHGAVDVEVMLEPSEMLLQQLDEGALDLTLITANEGQRPKRDGDILFAEPLVWAGLRGGVAWEREPLPLALATQGCPWRKAALNALDRAGIPYRIAYGSPHCAGQQAAMLADLAIAPFPASLIDPPFRRLGKSEGLPSLPNYQILLVRRADLGPAGETLAVEVKASFAALTEVQGPI
jgi:DNA-binding transcriptional LysR family regulator